MGYRARWLAVKNKPLDTVLLKIGLRRDAESGGQLRSPSLYAVNLPPDWLIVMGDGWNEMDLVQQDHARRLSIDTEAVHFYCDDTPMCASLVAYRDGQELWSVQHDGSGRARKTEVTGTPPALVKETIDRLRREQNAERDRRVDHLYDAAAEIGLALTGFRHDQDHRNRHELPIIPLATTS